MPIVYIFLLTFLAGPFGSVPFALAIRMSPLETAALVCAIHVALVPVWFGLMEAFKYGMLYRKHLVQRAMGCLGGKRVIKIGADAVREFERRVGQAGFGAGVIGFTFLFGIGWATLGACLLDVKKTTIAVSIAIGAALSSVFWALAFGGLVGFLPNPWVLYVVLMVATFGLLTYKKIRERELLRKLARRWGEESVRALRTQLRRVSRGIARA